MKSLGYVSILAPLGLLVLGRLLDADYLLPLAFFVGLPLLRLIFGSTPPGGVAGWTGAERRFLAWLPRVYAVGFVATMGWVLRTVAGAQPEGVLARALFVLAVLVMAGLASTVAHELSHRRQRWDGRVAMWITALSGYPFFVYEHWSHHLQPRDQERAQCPRRDEGMWGYVARRGLMAPRHAWALSQDLRQQGRMASVLDDQRLYVGVTLATAVAFAMLGGFYGAVLYGTLILGVPVLLNAITYIQHWGLGEDGPPEAKGIEQLAWDESSRLQAWLILGISFHVEHHDVPDRPYYEYGPTAGGPRLPADYALLFLLCCVPPLWRAVMTPVLDEWVTSLRVGKAHRTRSGFPRPAT